MARNGRFGWLAKSAGFRRDLQQHAGTGAIRQEKIPTDKGWDFGKWWRRGGSNPRPQVLYRQFYILSPVNWVLTLVRRPNRLTSGESPWI